MRLAAALLSLIWMVPAPGRAEGFGPSLTVLLDFRDGAPAGAVGELRREVQQILTPAGVQVDLRLRSEMQPGQDVSDLVMVRFSGSCASAVDPMMVDERGPAAFARSYTVGGDIQPFGEVVCDRVRRAVDTALRGMEAGQREELFGRALGRVLAHELVHMISKSPTHSQSGVFKESLSGSQLVSGKMELSAADIETLHRSHPGAKRKSGISDSYRSR